jgi:hypothetical protein
VNLYWQKLTLTHTTLAMFPPGDAAILVLIAQILCLVASVLSSYMGEKPRERRARQCQGQDDQGEGARVGES